MTAALLSGTAAVGHAQTIDPDWGRYVSKFVQTDGRVIDPENGRSHSEGQGTAMALAARHGDRKIFDLVADWTQRHLAVRDDDLYAWNWEDGRVADANDASDGDLMIAWGYAAAYKAWGDEGYKTSALAVASDIKSKLVRTLPTGKILIPGIVGFETDDELVVNLSYGVTPALKALAELDGDTIWPDLERGFATLSKVARTGALNLPPDWLGVPAGWDGDAKKLAPWKNRDPLFGWDGIRTPLYLAWGGAAAADLVDFAEVWAKHGGDRSPPSFDIVTATPAAHYSMPTGFVAVKRLVDRIGGAPTAQAPVVMKPDDTYYSSSLTMLAKLAWLDRFGG